jgi:hypothetical protein
MKVDRATGYSVESNIGGEKVDMGIAAGAMAHIMNVLTDLYSNRIYAVIREYCTNAWDAHVEAGVNRAIEVTLPNPMTPFFKVKDFGIGLTVEDIHSIYSQYGESTKRGTNAQNGMLGLGCKSALTYTNQFTVTSRKDGTEISVVVGRDEDGSGSMTVVDTRSTTEPNGTEIIVPVERHNVAEFQAEAEKFFRVWPEGHVLVNGKQPKRYEGLRLNDNLYITDEGQSYVVMGNVPYPAPELDDLCRGSVLAFVPIGDVNFVPSREALMDTKRTQTTLEGIKASFAKDVQGAIQREIDACQHPADAIRTIIQWEQKLPRQTIQAGAYTYKGRSMPDAHVEYAPQTDDAGNVVLDPATKQPVMVPVMIESTRMQNYHGMGKSWFDREWPVTRWPKTVWVTDFSVKHTAQIKRKLLKWVEEQGIAQDVENFVLLPGKAPKSEFVDQSRVVSYPDTIKKIALQPVQTASWKPARIPGSYDVYFGGKATVQGRTAGYEHGIPGDDFNQQYPIFYHRGNRWSASPWFDALSALYPDFTLVCLPENRLDKFKRIMPTTKQDREALNDAYTAWVSKLTDDQKLAIYMADQGYKHDLSLLDGTKITDPKLREAVRVAKIDVQKLIEKRRNYERVGGRQSIPGVKFTNPLHSYPLFNRSQAKHEHTYLYLNAAYAA